MSQLKFSLLTQFDDTTAVGIEAGYGFVYKVDVVTGQSSFVGFFDGENIKSHSLFSRGCVLNNYVYWAADKAKYIWSLNLSTEELKNHILPDDFKYTNKFYNVIAYENKLYYFSRKGLNVLKHDPQTDEMFVIKDVRCSNVQFKAGFRIGKFYYACVQDESLFFEFDLVREQYNIYQLPDEFRGAACPCLSGRKIWIAPRYQGDPFLIWDIEKKESELIYNPFGEGIKGNRISYIYCRSGQNHITAISIINGMSVSIDPQSKRFSKYPSLSIRDDQKIGVYGILNSSMILGVSDKEKTYYYDDVELYKLDFQSNTINKLSFFYDDKCSTNIRIMNCFKDNDLITENKKIGLSDFLGCL